MEPSGRLNSTYKTRLYVEAAFAEPGQPWQGQHAHVQPSAPPCDYLPTHSPLLTHLMARRACSGDMQPVSSMMATTTAAATGTQQSGGVPCSAKEGPGRALHCSWEHALRRSGRRCVQAHSTVTCPCKPEYAIHHLER